MIKSFADKRTQQIFDGHLVKKMDANLQKKVLRRLRYIEAAENIEDLRVPPSNKLEKKEGDLQDHFAIWVNRQWRVTFRWVDGFAHDVKLIDYH